MSAPFTPGPWHYLDLGEIVPSDGDGFPDANRRICFMAVPGSAINAHERIEANANLIAAAPELYEALRTARNQIIAFGLGPAVTVQAAEGAVQHIDAALAKAGGQS